MIVIFGKLDVKVYCLYNVESLKCENYRRKYYEENNCLLYAVSLFIN